jgi:hypothetical protein
MRQQHRYEDDDSPFDRNGVLKDGRTARHSMRDASRVIDAGLHRPGYRVTNDAALRDAKQQARDAYERDLQNAWRDGGSEGAEGSVCTVRNDSYPGYTGSAGHIRNGVCTPDALQGDARRKVTQRDPQGREAGTLEEEEDVTDARPPVRDSRTLDQIRHDHQQRMSGIYGAYDASIREQWRKP